MQVFFVPLDLMWFDADKSKYWIHNTLRNVVFILIQTVGEEIANF